MKIASEKFLDIVLGIVIAIAAALVLIPLVSWGISQFTDWAGITPGPILRVLSIVITLIVLLALTLKWSQPSQKWLFLIYVLLLGAGFLVVYMLPEWIPTMFSAVPETATPVLFGLSPLMSGVIGIVIVWLLYKYYKRK